jgi:hypothetical protein
MRNSEYIQALEELKIARINFDNAEPEFFNAANAELTAAELKVDAILNDERVSLTETAK